MPNHLLLSEINSQRLLLAQSNRQSYGLGFPKTASTGGGTRLVNPDEGGLRGGRSYSRPRNPIPSPPGAVIDEAEVPPAPPALPMPARKRRQLPLLTLITPEDGGRTASSQPVLYWYLHDRHTQVSTSPSKVDSNNPKSALIGKLSVTTGDSTGDSDAIAIFQTDLKMHLGLYRF